MNSVFSSFLPVLQWLVFFKPPSLCYVVESLCSALLPADHGWTSWPNPVLSPHLLWWPLNRSCHCHQPSPTWVPRDCALLSGVTAAVLSSCSAAGFAAFVHQSLVAFSDDSQSFLAWGLLQSWNKVQGLFKTKFFKSAGQFYSPAPQCWMGYTCLWGAVGLFTRKLSESRTQRVRPRCGNMEFGSSFP